MPCQWLAMQLTDGALAVIGCTIHSPNGAADVAFGPPEGCCAARPFSPWMDGLTKTSSTAPPSKPITQSSSNRPSLSILSGPSVRRLLFTRDTNTVGSHFVFEFGTPFDLQFSSSGSDGVKRHARRCKPTSMPLRMKDDPQPWDVSAIQRRSAAGQPMTTSSSASDADIASSSSCVERFP